MSVRQEFAGLFLCLVPAAWAQSAQDLARSAVEASAARQRAAVAAMQLSIAKQRAALAPGGREPRPSGQPAGQNGTPFFTLSWPAFTADCAPLPDGELNPLIHEAAQQEGLEEGLLRAVAEEESGFRACAVSPKGAMGLMQLMPSTAQGLGVRDPFDPRENLLSGARFLKQLLTRFGGDPALALAAYNAGPERVQESGGMPRIPETVDYVRDILAKIPLP